MLGFKNTKPLYLLNSYFFLISMNATRPKEIIYLHYFATEVVEGTVYSFFALDDYSTFVFSLGHSPELTTDSILEPIKKLMKDKHFKSSPKKPFTLVLSVGKEIEDKIRTIIKPHKGKVVFDAVIVANKTKHFISSFQNR